MKKKAKAAKAKPSKEFVSTIIKEEYGTIRTDDGRLVTSVITTLSNGVKIECF